MDSSRDTRELYDSTANQWVRFEKKLLSDFTARPSVLAECGNLEGMRVLDLGCGEGYMSRLFLAAGAAEVVGIDVSEKMILAASSSTDGSNSDFRVGDLRNGLPAISGSFDLVAAVFVFNYLTDEEVQRVMTHLLDILTIEGRVIITIPHPALPHLRRSELAREIFDFLPANQYLTSGGNLMQGHIQDVEGRRVKVQAIERTVQSFLNSVSLKSWRLEKFAELGLPEGEYPERFAPLRGVPLHLLLSYSRSKR